MTLEIVAQSSDDARAAAHAGADRLELVSALSLGGLTPSLGTLEAVLASCDLPVAAMLRPRSGGFAYSTGELDAMERDAARFLEAGAKGLVFGVLDEDGVDVKANARLVRAGGKAVFHRAFDALPDPLDALERLIDLGFRRVLTSGGRGTALEGADTIRRLIERADGRIEILPGGGVRPAIAREIVARTGASALHLAGLEWAEDPTAAGMAFHSPAHPEDGYGRVDPRIVAEMRNLLPKGDEPLQLS